MRITQEKIAEQTGLSQKTISALMLGTRGCSPENAEKLGRLCKCDPFVFMRRDGGAVRKVFEKCFGYGAENDGRS